MGKWNRWQERQRVPWLLSLAEPAGVDRHIKVGLGKPSAFLLTFDRKGINRTTYHLCLYTPDENFHNSVPKCVLLSEEKTPP